MGNTMKQPIKILAVLKTRETNQAVSAVAARAVQAQIDVRIGEVRELAPRLVNGHAPDVLLADVNLDDTADLEALGNFARTHGTSTVVIATSSSATLDGMRRLMRVGIQDFVPQPIVEADLMSALEGALQRRQQADRRQHLVDQSTARRLVHIFNRRASQPSGLLERERFLTRRHQRNLHVFGRGRDEYSTRSAF